ncbi:TetR/AcrR family transcriptional regulator [Paenibacillus sp. 1001270B_150601_E10]|uniref:TetR/AcrR family transcriptional regulator n=1 Tax=Paenibacillus sp. 1001270B_150601_E10 TaxID=2787079 RepID=UPI002B4BDE74|nr:TetR/AcrR family transcriptional regulator [Paenibacillus sp. 1001270B_150601_E10]
MLRESRKQDLKEKIFLESIRLFAVKGMDHVSVSEITKACGVAKGTFYNYFPTKESVLLYLGQSQLEMIIEQAAETDKPLKERILFAFKQLTNRLEEHPALMKAAVAEAVKSMGATAGEMDTIGQFKLWISKMFHEEQIRQEVRFAGEMEDIASILVGTYFSSIMFWLHEEQSVEELHQGVNRRVSLLLDQLIMNI